MGCGDDDPAGPSGGTGDVEVTIGNDLEDEDGETYDIIGIYISPSSSSTWGENQLSEILEWGYSASGTFAQDTYDIRIVDEDEDTYTRWEVEVNGDGYTWNVTLDDMD